MVIFWSSNTHLKFMLYILPRVLPHKQDQGLTGNKRPFSRNLDDWLLLGRLPTQAWSKQGKFENYSVSSLILDLYLIQSVVSSAILHYCPSPE